MRLTAYILIAGLPLAACADNGNNDVAEGRADAINGEATYFEYCAKCHASGESGAPQVGVREDWENRSHLWQAVLMEHAKCGFIDMPARGGNPELSDEVVSAAAQYMLEQTFPDRPKD